MALGYRLSKALAKSQAIPTLIWLRANSGASANKIARGVGTDPNTATDAVQHLVLHGLAEVRWIESQFPGREQMEVSLTPMGADIAARLEELATRHEEHLVDLGAHPPKMKKVRALREGRDVAKKPK